MQKRPILTLAAALLLCTACHENKFSVEGTIAGGGDSTTLVLEESGNGTWYIVDSVTTEGEGRYRIKADAPSYPNIYRLRLGGQSVCFPVDSLDRLTLDSSRERFATDYTLDGTEQARQVMAIDKAAMAFASGARPDSEYEAWKNDLARRVVGDPSGIVAYYTINKSIGNRLLFDPLNDRDLKIIGAVANGFNTFRPNDPRKDYLVNVLLDGQRRRREANQTARDTVFVDVTSLIDIKLQDYSGKRHSLMEVSSKHPVVLLSFTVYDSEPSPVYNKLLNDIYTRHHSQGVEIYQVGLDPDNVVWRQAAENLPWITVYDPMSVNSSTVSAYQVWSIPTTYVIAHGDIVERVDDPQQLEAAVSRRL